MSASLNTALQLTVISLKFQKRVGKGERETKIESSLLPIPEGRERERHREKRKRRRKEKRKREEKRKEGRKEGRIEKKRRKDLPQI